MVVPAVDMAAALAADPVVVVPAALAADPVVVVPVAASAADPEAFLEALADTDPHHPTDLMAAMVVTMGGVAAAAVLYWSWGSLFWQQRLWL